MSNDGRSQKTEDRLRKTVSLRANEVNEAIYED